MKNQLLEDRMILMAARAQALFTLQSLRSEAISKGCAYSLSPIYRAAQRSVRIADKSLADFDTAHPTVIQYIRFNHGIR